MQRPAPPSEDVTPSRDRSRRQAVGWGKVCDIAARAIASRRAISPVIRSASAAKRSSRSSSGTLRYERNRSSNVAKSSLIAAALVCVGGGCVGSTLSCFLPWVDLDGRRSKACQSRVGGLGSRGHAACVVPVLPLAGKSFSIVSAIKEHPQAFVVGQRPVLDGHQRS